MSADFLVFLVKFLMMILQIFCKKTARICANFKVVLIVELSFVHNTFCNELHPDAVECFCHVIFGSCY